MTSHILLVDDQSVKAEARMADRVGQQHGKYIASGGDDAAIQVWIAP